MTFSAVSGTVAGLYPGTAQNLTIHVTNPKPYPITVDAASLGAVVWGQSTVTLHTPTDADLAFGSIGSVTIPAHTAAGDGANDVTIPVTLNGAAGDDYQGNSAQVTLSLHASAF